MKLLEKEIIDLILREIERRMDMDWLNNQLS